MKQAPLTSCPQPSPVHQATRIRNQRPSPAYFACGRLYRAGMHGAEERTSGVVGKSFDSARAYGEAGMRSAVAFGRAGARSVAAFLDAGLQTVAAFDSARRSSHHARDGGT